MDNKGFAPKEILKEASVGFKKRRDFWEKIKNNTIYHIEDWKSVHMIPGGVYFSRVHYIFDSEDKKAFFLDIDEKIKVVSAKKEIDRLISIIEAPEKFIAEGVYSRKLNLDSSSFLFNLILIMNSKWGLVLSKLSLEKEKETKKRENDYLKMIFNIIISTK